MNEEKLNEYLNDFGKAHSPEPSRALIDSIMRVPHEIEKETSFSWNMKDWFLFLVPRLSGLTAACIMGIYLGGAGSSALAEDEIAVIEQEVIFMADAGIVLDENVETLLDVEEFIFVEEQAQ
tara:strand:- start:234780 stop:235145 length:366 start_codon:yes stop_codon:yes gene_type:complete